MQLFVSSFPIETDNTLLEFAYGEKEIMIAV